MSDKDLNTRVEDFIKSKVEPIISSHGGKINIKSIENGIVTIALTGNCSYCPSAQITTEEIVKSRVVEEFKGEIIDVRLNTDISEEMWEYAKTFLRHE